ncbi:hypothetical protein ABEB36_011705 [Hypothenemus hampei]|uniref:Ig-like domain-containing protein n=2 Tax=Hypothenemus hampei TaxID=57062 RepID=A0ABD1E8Q7_HYPHA
MLDYCEEFIFVLEIMRNSETRSEMLVTSNAGLVFLLSGVFLLSQESSSLKSMMIKVPTAVRTGDTVTLKCEYDLEGVLLYSIKWYWNEEEFYRFIPKESPPYQAFPVKSVNINVDLSKSGENDVVLREVQRQLTGNYKCEVSADGPLFHTEDMTSHMTVVDLPHGDPMMNIRDTKVEIGKEVNVECSLSGSHPVANITWFINNKEVKDNSDFITIYPTQTELDNALDLLTSRSKVTILTNKSHFIQGVMVIRCDATIYNLYKGTAENFIRDDSPKLAQVLGSTLSQSQLDPTFGELLCSMYCCLREH